MKYSELKIYLDNLDTCKITGEFFDEPIYMKGQINANGIIFANCTFDKGCFLNNALIDLGIKFKNCSFNSSLEFKNCNVYNYDESFNKEYASIVISSCKIDQLIFEGNNSFERGVLIEDATIMERLIVGYIRSSSGGFYLSKSTINEQFDFFYSDIEGTLDFNLCSINCKVRVFDLKASTISFINSTFLKDIHIDKSNLNGIIFNNGHFKDDLYFRANQMEGNLSIIGAEFSQEFNIDFSYDNKIGTIGDLYISSSKFLGDFIVNGSDGVIKNAQIDFNKQLEGSIFFNSCQFKEIILKGVNYNSSLFYNSCAFNSLNLNHLHNYSSIAVSSGVSFGDNSKLSIINSSLGKLSIYNIDLNKFNEVNIVDSTLVDMMTANVIWFDNQKLNKNTPVDKRHSQNKEVFRQLKYLLEKQGNRIDSLEFKALEIDSFRHEINQQIKQNNVHWFCKRFIHANSSNRIILWLGRTNNFGLNWIKPTVLILLLSILFYCLIIVGVSDMLSFTPNLGFSNIRMTFGEFYNYLPALPQLMNPAHNIDNIFPDVSRMSFTVHFLDYTFKLFLAFFIFQIISAFRKYMK